jgi:hypothetical protein
MDHNHSDIVDVTLNLALIILKREISLLEFSCSLLDEQEHKEAVRRHLPTYYCGIAGQTPAGQFLKSSKKVKE